MAKVIIKTEKLTSFGGIFSIMEHFDSILSSVIDSTLGMRCQLYGYQYREIIRSLIFPTHPTQARPATSTWADKLNTLLLNCLLATGQLKEGEGYDVDFGHQFIETEKYDAKPTYKKFIGYSPGVAVIGDLIVGIENRRTKQEQRQIFFGYALQGGGSPKGNSDGNTNVRFHQKDTLRRFFERLVGKGLTVNRFRADCGFFSKEIVEEVGKHCKIFYIRANRCGSLYDDIFTLRGCKKEGLDGIEFELNSILVEKWKGKAYRFVIQRQKRIDGELDMWEGEYTYRSIPTNGHEASEREIIRE